MNCAFQKSFDGARWECQRKECGATFIVKAGQTNPPKRNCGAPPRTQRCQHMGQPTGFVECPTCNGDVRLKVFACDVHQQCTMKKPMNGLACCATCREYVAIKDTADEAGSAAG